MGVLVVLCTRHGAMAPSPLPTLPDPIETAGLEIHNHLENLRWDVNGVAREDVALRVRKLWPLRQRLEEPGFEVVVDGLCVVLGGVRVRFTMEVHWSQIQPNNRSPHQTNNQTPSRHCVPGMYRALFPVSTMALSFPSSLYCPPRSRAPVLIHIHSCMCACLYVCAREIDHARKPKPNNTKTETKRTAGVSIREHALVAQRDALHPNGVEAEGWLSRCVCRYV